EIRGGAALTVEVSELIGEDPVHERSVNHGAQVAGRREPIAFGPLIEIEDSVRRRLFLPERLLELPDPERDLREIAPSDVNVLRRSADGGRPRGEVELQPEVEVLVDEPGQFRSHLAEVPGVGRAADVVPRTVRDDAPLDPDVAAENDV